MTIETEVLETGCVRQKTAGRGAYELMSPFALERDAKLFEWGAENRGHRNWEKGMPFSRAIQSTFRHLIKYMMREPDEDHDDNLGGARFWLGVLMHYEEMIRRGLLPPELDDRPSYIPKGAGLREAMYGTSTLGSPDESPPSGVVTEPLRIYVAGPIRAKTAYEVNCNIKRAEVIGTELEDMGHYVIIPHRYVDPRIPGVGKDRTPQYEYRLKMDFGLIEHWANTLFLVGLSPGADRERALAESLGYTIYERIADVPKLEDCEVDQESHDNTPLWDPDLAYS